MNKSILLLVLVATALGLSGCDEGSNTPDYAKKVGYKKTQSIEKWELGGQPGEILVHGIIVSEDSKLDPRISIVAKGGAGKDKTEAPLMSISKPRLSSSFGETRNQTAEMKRTSIVSIGCDEQTISDFAKERSLVVETAPTLSTEQFYLVIANTIVLCGDLGIQHFDYLTFSAHELVLKNVTYSLTTTMGSLQFYANKLTLLGTNTIETKGADSSMTIRGAPSIQFGIAKEISSDANGSLVLKSTGSNYDPTKK